MDIMLNIDRTSFGIFVIMLTLFSNVESRSIFDIIMALQPEKCSSFTNHVNCSIADPTVIYPPGNTDKINYEYEITSPNFPRNYPTNLQCVTLIKAPNFDYKIVVEVREKFELEPSKNCVSDYLEINDGPYGFSNKIGKFCKSESMPKEIRSSGPFLWLRFFSDASLPHSGFKIVYRFIKQLVKPQLNYCYKQTIIPDHDSFNLNTSFLLSEFKNFTKIYDNTSIPLECVFDFYVKPELSTFIYKSKFTQPKDPLPCEDNFMEIYHMNTVNDRVKSQKQSNYLKICKDEEFKVRHFTKSYRTSVRFSTKSLSKINDFRFTIVPMKPYKNGCPERFYLCYPMWCISKQFICNNIINCPEKIDKNCFEERLLEKGEEIISNITNNLVTTQSVKDEEIAQIKANNTHAIILSSITVILVLCMVVCLVITIHSKKKDRSKNRINLAEFDNINQDSSQNKRLFYEHFIFSEPIGPAFSSEKLNKKDYANNSIWSKRVVSEDMESGSNRFHNSILKLNGGITADPSIKSLSYRTPKLKIEKMKTSSMHKIGKYLSVPNPSKNDCTQNSINLNHQNRSFGITSPSDDIQSISSQSYSKHNSSNHKSIYQHIQRASSMGSGLRKQLLEPMKNGQYPKNIEWYCGPVIRSSSNESSTRNDSSDMLNAYSAKTSTHVPGCRSLPNVNYIGLQSLQVYFTKPSSDKIVDVTDSLDFSYDDNSSYKDEVISVKNQFIRDNSNQPFESKRNYDEFSSSYGFKYFCAHEPSRSKDFVEYIA